MLQKRASPQRRRSFCPSATIKSDQKHGIQLYDYSPEHMLEGIGESVSWVAGVLRE